jgi:hypothetical protein
MNAKKDEERQTADERGSGVVKLTEETLEIHLRKSAIRFILFVFASIGVHSWLIFFGKRVAASVAGKAQIEG